MIFLPALDWLVAGAIIVALFFVIIMALLVTPPSALVDKMNKKDKDSN